MTISQDIFKAFGPNWKWASLDGNGLARVHCAKPVIAHAGIVRTKKGEIYEFAPSRAEAFDARELSPDPAENAVIVERTDFSNGPTYETDAFGVPLCPQPVAPLPPTNTWELPAPPPPPAPVVTQTRLTTDEAENGMLWGFARSYEAYVSVNLFGVVWFNTSNEGNAPRCAADVVVDGVTHVIERTRVVEAPAPYMPPPSFYEQPSAAPVAPFVVHHPESNPPTGKVDDGECKNPMCQRISAQLYEKLEEPARTKAKERARYLMLEGHLTSLQYTAIFGELPK